MRRVIHGVAGESRRDRCTSAAASSRTWLRNDAGSSPTNWSSAASISSSVASSPWSSSQSEFSQGGGATRSWADANSPNIKSSSSWPLSQV